MNHILTESKNKELAALMIKKAKQGGKLNRADSEAYQTALTGFNARAAGHRKRMSKKPIDWESGKDARAEGHIARATTGVKKQKKGAARAAAKAHGEKVEESSTGRENLRRRADAVQKKVGIDAIARGAMDRNPVFRKERAAEKSEDSRTTLAKAISHKRSGDTKAYKRMIKNLLSKKRDEKGILDDHKLGSFDSLKKKIDYIEELIKKTVRGARRFAGQPVDLAGRGVQGAGTGVEKTGQGIEKGGKFISKKAGQGISKAGQIAGTGVQKVGSAAGTGVQKVGSAAGAGIQKTGDIAGGAIKNVAKPVGKAAKYASKVAGSTMKGAGKVSTGTGKLVGKGGRAAGSAMMRSGAAMSSTGVGMLGGIPLAALGALTYGAGTAGEVVGRAGGAALKGAGTATKAAGGAIGKGVEYGTKAMGQAVQTGSKIAGAGVKGASHVAGTGVKGVSHVAGGATKLAGKAAGKTVHGLGAAGSMAAGKTVGLAGKGIKSIGGGISKVGKAVSGDSAKTSSGPAAKKDVKFGPGSSQVARYTQKQAA